MQFLPGRRNINIPRALRPEADLRGPPSKRSRRSRRSLLNLPMPRGSREGKAP